MRKIALVALALAIVMTSTAFAQNEQLKQQLENIRKDAIENPAPQLRDIFFLNVQASSDYVLVEFRFSGEKKSKKCEWTRPKVQKGKDMCPDEVTLLALELGWYNTQLTYLGGYVDGDITALTGGPGVYAPTNGKIVTLSLASNWLNDTVTVGAENVEIRFSEGNDCFKDMFDRTMLCYQNGLDLAKDVDDGKDPDVMRAREIREKLLNNGDGVIPESWKEKFKNEWERVKEGK